MAAKTARKTSAKPAPPPKEEFEVMNISELSRRFNLDRATVARRIEDAGIKPKYKKSKETVYDVTPELEDALTAVDADYDLERTRKVKAEADIKEMEAAKRRDELLSTADVIAHVQTVFGAVHKKCQAIPTKSAAKLAKAKTAAEVKKILNFEIDSIFNELRNDHAKLLNAG